MPAKHSRIERERRTMEVMIEVYCRGKHGIEIGECAECSELRSYAVKRLEKCPFQEEKPPCADCPIHCYQAARRQQMKEVMRYAGPRMMFRHPIFALRHWLDGFRKAPARPGRQAGGPPAAASTSGGSSRGTAG